MRSFPLAEYEQRVPIRIGSLSQCFAAQHAGEEVLLKQLLPAFARVPAIAAAWLERAEHNSRLDHPGCSKVLEWGEALGESYLTLPVVAAASLRELTQAAAKAGLWPRPEAVVSIAEDALRALAYASAAFGLVHLDLDPHALLLRKDGSVLLTEFGMWRALPTEAATRERFDRGRVAYLCPELTKSLDGDARSDVFSLGAILYELIGKERPFHGATQLVTAMAIAEGRRRPLREHAPHAPELLCDIIETMLAQKPEERFQSAQAALGALSSCCQAERAAVVDWVESLELRAGPQAGFARARRAAQAPAAAQIAASAGRGTAPSEGRQGDAFSSVTPPLLAPASGGRGNLQSPLPPPLLSPPALVEAGVSRSADAPPQDDWLAPPPLLSPGGRPSGAVEAAGVARDEAAGLAPQAAAGFARAAAGLAREEAAGLARDAAAGLPRVETAGLAHQAAAGLARDAAAGFAHQAAAGLADDAGAPKVRDGRTAFLDTGAARAALAQERSASRAPDPELPPPPNLAASGTPWTPMGEMVTRDTPALHGSGSQRPLALEPAPRSLPPKPLLGPLPPPSMSSSRAPAPQPLLSSLPPLEHEPPHAADRRGWQEPSKTVFQVKAFAKHATRRSDARAPLLVIVLLSVAFGFALVAGGALLWRLFAS